MFSDISGNMHIEISAALILKNDNSKRLQMNVIENGREAITIS